MNLSCFLNSFNAISADVSVCFRSMRWHAESPSKKLAEKIILWENVITAVFIKTVYRIENTHELRKVIKWTNLNLFRTYHSTEDQLPKYKIFSSWTMINNFPAYQLKQSSSDPSAFISFLVWSYFHTQFVINVIIITVLSNEYWLLSAIFVFFSELLNFVYSRMITIL